MIARCKTAFLFLIVSLFFLIGTNIPCQANRALPKAYSLVELGKGHIDCRAKGRFQDKEYCSSPVIDQIVSDGKDSIPILISQLADEHRTPQPAYDFWNYTTIGDIAEFVLDNLFTDSDSTTFTMPGLNWVRRDCHGEAAEQCWREFVQRHGRHFVQQQWSAAWNMHKNEIYWDAKARCFRVK